METTAPSGLVDIDATAFADRPLFTIDAIAELADRLPPDSVPVDRAKAAVVRSMTKLLRKVRA